MTYRPPAPLTRDEALAAVAEYRQLVTDGMSWDADKRRGSRLRRRVFHDQLKLRDGGLAGTLGYEAAAARRVVDVLSGRPGSGTDVDGALRSLTSRRADTAMVVDRAYPAPAPGPARRPVAEVSWA